MADLLVPELADFCVIELTEDGRITGLAGQGVLMRGPYRLIVADVDSKTICVEIWAATEEDFAAWLPVAQEFVEFVKGNSTPMVAFMRP